MTLIEHCITDIKSYLAVLKVLREQNHPTITANVRIVADVWDLGSSKLRTWMTHPDSSNCDTKSRFYTVKIWPPELDP